MTRKSTPQILEDRTSRPPEVNAGWHSPSDPEGVHADQLLIERCLAGEVSAWAELYNQHHTPLCASIKSLIGPGYCDPNLIDEIAARVWYALVKNDGRLLDRFDPNMNLRLGAFFRGLARIEIMQYFRAERRRHVREAQAGRKTVDNSSLSDWQLDAMLDEFTTTLTLGEQRFLEEYLLSMDQKEAEADSPALSDANIWQRRHRIRSKLRAFFSED
jgi:hypothetical protein